MLRPKLFFTCIMVLMFAAPALVNPPTRPLVTVAATLPNGTLLYLPLIVRHFPDLFVTPTPCQGSGCPTNTPGPSPTATHTATPDPSPTPTLIPTRTPSRTPTLLPGIGGM